MPQSKYSLCLYECMCKQIDTHTQYIFSIHLSIYIFIICQYGKLLRMLHKAKKLNKYNFKIQIFTNHVLQNYTLETYMILLTSHLNKFNYNKIKIFKVFILQLLYCQINILYANEIMDHVFKQTLQTLTSRQIAEERKKCASKWEST